MSSYFAAAGGGAGEKSYYVCTSCFQAFNYHGVFRRSCLACELAANIMQGKCPCVPWTDPNVKSEQAPVYDCLSLVLGVKYLLFIVFFYI